MRRYGRLSGPSSWVRLATSAVLLLATLGITTATAEPESNLGLREDSALTKLITQLDSRLAKRSHLGDLDQVILLRDDTIQNSAETYAFIRNTVVRLAKAPDGEFVREMTAPVRATIEDVQVWIVRDGKVRRPEGEPWQVSERDGGRRLVYRLADLKDGDVVGLSYAEKYQSPFLGGYVALWEDLPVMMTRLRVGGGRELAYHIEGWHLLRDKWSVKTLAEHEGEPTDLRFTTMDVGAASGVPAGTPPHAELPFVMVSVKGRWVERMNTWFSAVSWNEIAVGVSGMLEGLDEETGAFQAKATQIVGDETAPAARADLLHAWVQQNYADVDLFDRTYVRDDFASLLNASRAQGREKVMLLYVLGRSLGVEFEALATRNSDYGTLRRGLLEMRQLTDLILRLPGEEPRYYCPADAAAAAGIVPENLRGRDALLVKRGLTEAMKDLQSQVMQTAGASMEMFQQTYKDKIRQADFAVWEKIP